MANYDPYGSQLVDIDNHRRTYTLVGTIVGIASGQTALMSLFGSTSGIIRIKRVEATLINTSGSTTQEIRLLYSSSGSTGGTTVSLSGQACTHDPNDPPSFASGFTYSSTAGIGFGKLSSVTWGIASVFNYTPGLGGFQSGNLWLTGTASGAAIQATIAPYVLGDWTAGNVKEPVLRNNNQGLTLYLNLNLVTSLGRTDAFMRFLYTEDTF